MKIKRLLTGNYRVTKGRVYLVGDDGKIEDDIGGRLKPKLPYPSTEPGKNEYWEILEEPAISMSKYRYVVMHDTESGFETVSDAVDHININHSEDRSEFRVVGIIEPLPPKPEVEKEILAVRGREMEHSYCAGKQYERDRIRNLLGV